MDQQRNFSDEREPDWYGGDRSYPEQPWPGAEHHPPDARRLPDPRSGHAGEGRYADPGNDRFGAAGRYDDPGYLPPGGESYGGDRYGDPGRSNQRGPGRRPADGGPGTFAAGGGPVRQVADQVGPGVEPNPALQDPTGPMPMVGGRMPEAGTARDGVYRDRRPAMALLLLLVTLFFEIPALMVFFAGLFGGEVQPGGVVAGTFLILGLPLTAFGLHSAVRGAGGPIEPARSWLRPPTVHLTVGLVLLVAAGLAAS